MADSFEELKRQSDTDQKQPLYKRKWFMIAALLVGIAIIGNLGDDPSTPQPLAVSTTTTASTATKATVTTRATVTTKGSATTKPATASASAGWSETDVEYQLAVIQSGGAVSLTDPLIDRSPGFSTMLNLNASSPDV